MTHTISDQLLTQLSEFVTARFGLHFPKKRWRDLARKIATAADDLGCADAASCIRWLTTAQLTRDQLDTLACHLTIGETYFFRERNGFDLLEEEIVPALVSSRRGRDQRLRVWSAGCSTGEEAYSIAILLHRMIADLPRWNITILATDVNAASLRKAVRGEYGDWSFRGVPRWIKERYFTRNEEGRYVVAERVRRMVTFAQLNLAQDPYPSLSTNTNAMDVIFCRNVLMYFAHQQMEKVVENFRHSLVAGAWLLVSPCETSHTLFSGFESVGYHDGIFYRKDGRGKAPSPGPAAPGDTASPFPMPGMAPGAVSPPAFTPPSAAPLPSAVPRTFPYEEALALYRAGNYAEAATKLIGRVTSGEGAAGAPAGGQVAALLARVFANQGNFAAALEWSEKAISAAKLDPELRYLQAIILQEQDDDDAAAAALKKTLYLDHAFVLAHFALANISLKQGKVKEAARHLENAASLLAAFGADDILPGSEGMSARRLGEIIAAIRMAAVG